MDLKEAKEHMIAHGECWQFYTKRMDPMSRDTMVAEQKRLMREGHKVSTPQTYALACMGMMMFDGREIPLSPEMKSALQVSEGSERTAEVSPLASAGSDPKECKVCGSQVPRRNFNCCSDQCYREAYA